MEKFIYALCEDDRLELLAKGYKELFHNYMGGKKIYAFANEPQKIAMFSGEDRKKFLFTNMAHF